MADKKKDNAEIAAEAVEKGADSPASTDIKAETDGPSYSALAPLIAEEENISVLEAEERLKNVPAEQKDSAQGTVDAAREAGPTPAKDSGSKK